MKTMIIFCIGIMLYAVILTFITTRLFSKGWMVKIMILVCVLAAIPVMFPYFKWRESIDRFNENPRIVTVQYDSLEKHKLDILVKYNISKFDSGETVVLSRSFWSDDFRLKDLNFEIFRDKSVLHGLNDIQMIHDNGWYSEGLFLSERAGNYACFYTAYKKVTVIHDSKN